jgi:uncharacterized protein (TIGR03437 family)
MSVKTLFGRYPLSTYILALICPAAFTQGFNQLATNRDGSVLYFSSPLRMKGTDQYLHPKIFIWDSIGGVRLYLERASDVPFPLPTYGFAGTQFFSLVSPDVSSDGTTVAVTGIRFCDVSSICVTGLEQYQSTIDKSGQAPVMASGSASLSRNGRFALFRSSILLPVPAQMQLLDLQTGQQSQYQGAWLQPGPKHQVADDGTVVLQGFQGGIYLAQNGRLNKIISSTAPAPSINNSATLIFYESVIGSPAVNGLFSFSIPTNTITSLAIDSPNSPGFHASISDDGSEVAFIQGPNRQAYVIHSDGTGLRQITKFSEPVTEIEMSGDGSAAFAVTASNRIVRIVVATTDTTEIVPSTPYTNVPSANGFLNSYVSAYAFVVSRGTVTSVGGSGFATDAQSAPPPFPLSLDGAELHVNGSRVPIAGVSPESVAYPAPWNLPDTPVDVEVWVLSASASPFIPGFEVEPSPPALYMLSRPAGPLLAVHQDFSSLVSNTSPAQPGEVIHVYAHDLGAVSPPPPAGLPAPISPLALLVPSISCFVNSDAEPNAMDPTNVLFVGLAPELLDVFQIDVQLPSSFPGNPSRLLCRIGDPVQGYLIAGLLPVGGLP